MTTQQQIDTLAQLVDYANRYHDEHETVKALEATMAEIERLRAENAKLDDIFRANMEDSLELPKIRAELEQSKAERAKYEAAILAVLHSDDHEHARSIAEAAYHGSEAVRRLQDTQGEAS